MFQNGEVYVKVLHNLNPAKCSLSILDEPTAEARAVKILAAAADMGIPGV